MRKRTTTAVARPAGRARPKRKIWGGGGGGDGRGFRVAVAGPDDGAIGGVEREAPPAGGQAVPSASAAGGTEVDRGGDGLALVGHVSNVTWEEGGALQSPGGQRERRGGAEPSGISRRTGRRRIPGGGRGGAARPV